MGQAWHHGAAVAAGAGWQRALVGRAVALHGAHGLRGLGRAGAPGAVEEAARRLHLDAPLGADGASSAGSRGDWLRPVRARPVLAQTHAPHGAADA
eukprot:5755612-Lingulodinium_polyedra.AAC.1